MNKKEKTNMKQPQIKITVANKESDRPMYKFEIAVQTETYSTRECGFIKTTPFITDKSLYNFDKMLDDLAWIADGGEATPVISCRLTPINQEGAVVDGPIAAFQIDPFWACAERPAEYADFRDYKKLVTVVDTEGRHSKVEKSVLDIYHPMLGTTPRKTQDLYKLNGVMMQFANELSTQNRYAIWNHNTEVREQAYRGLCEACTRLGIKHNIGKITDCNTDYYKAEAALKTSVFDIMPNAHGGSNDLVPFEEITLNELADFFFNMHKYDLEIPYAYTQQFKTTVQSLKKIIKRDPVTGKKELTKVPYDKTFEGIQFSWFYKNARKNRHDLDGNRNTYFAEYCVKTIPLETLRVVYTSYLWCKSNKLFGKDYTECPICGNVYNVYEGCPGHIDMIPPHTTMGNEAPDPEWRAIGYSNCDIPVDSIAYHDGKYVSYYDFDKYSDERDILDDSTDSDDFDEEEYGIDNNSCSEDGDEFESEDDDNSTQQDIRFYLEPEPAIFNNLIEDLLNSKKH